MYITRSGISYSSEPSSGLPATDTRLIQYRLPLRSGRLCPIKICQKEEAQLHPLELERQREENSIEKAT